jgi:hypothetical protein
MCEEGYAWPLTLTVASDSHSNMYGGMKIMCGIRNCKIRFGMPWDARSKNRCCCNMGNWSYMVASTQCDLWYPLFFVQMESDHRYDEKFNWKIL